MLSNAVLNTSPIYPTSIRESPVSNRGRRDAAEFRQQERQKRVTVGVMICTLFRGSLRDFLKFAADNSPILNRRTGGGGKRRGPAGPE